MENTNSLKDDPTRYDAPPNGPSYGAPYKTKVDLTKVAKFDTGAQRSSGEGKGRYDLIPVRPTRRLAIKYQQGADAYGARNWEKGMPFSRLFDSAKRHIDQYIDGDRTEDHLAAAVWNLFAVMHFETCLPHLNDIPQYDNCPVSGPQPPETTVGGTVHIGRQVLVEGQPISDAKPDVTEPVYPAEFLRDALVRV